LAPFIDEAPVDQVILPHLSTSNQKITKIRGASLGHEFALGLRRVLVGANTSVARER
jgi:hypothetical protein